jgi:phage tail protein X
MIKKWVAAPAMALALTTIALPVAAATAACPATIPNSGFTDLSGLDAVTIDAIDCLVFYGITKGTSTTTYSPQTEVARWQMALFLVRSAAAMGVSLPTGSDQGFSDITGLDAATQLAINQLAQLGITKGITPTTFEPNLGVARWQMALFLVRLIELDTGVVQPMTIAPFQDVGGLDQEVQRAINRLYELGVAKGTTATTFSPFVTVLRWQTALFLTRALDVESVTPPPGTSGLTVSVSSLSLLAGSQVTITATLIADDGSPVPGVAVQLDGLEAGILNATTNSSGVATFTYTGPPVDSEDLFEVFADTDGDGDFLGPDDAYDFGTVYWVINAPDLPNPTIHEIIRIDSTSDFIDVISEAGYYRLHYDANDAFYEEGSPVDLATFEATVASLGELPFALIDTASYAAATTGVSSFDLLQF